MQFWRVLQHANKSCKVPSSSLIFWGLSSSLDVSAWLGFLHFFPFGEAFAQVQVSGHTLWAERHKLSAASTIPTISTSLHEYAHLLHGDMLIRRLELLIMDGI